MSIEWSELSDYLAGELDAEREAELERELFETPANPAAAFLAVVDGIRVMRARHCTLSGVLRADAIDELRRQGRVLELEIAPSEIVACHIPEDTPMCVAHLAVDLAGVARVDLEYLDGAGETYARACDVPVDRESGRVIVACERHVALLQEVTVFRVVAVERGRRRVLGDFGVRNEPPLA